MLRLFFDHDFNHKILRGLIQKIHNLDFITPSQLGNIAESDENYLTWALQNRRVIISHDVNTMTEAAYNKLKQNEQIFGLILVPQNLAVGEAIAELEMIISCSEENDFENTVIYLPLGLT